MPGISIKCHAMEKDELALQSLKSLLHDERYVSQVLLQNKLYFVGCTRYSEYPITIFEDDNLWVCIDGRIYGKEHNILKHKLHDLMTTILDGGTTDKISKWLLETDGDFVICALDKHSQDFIIINDALGRLPIYYYRGSNEVVISRELQFVIDLTKQPKLDRMAIAQYLLFHYPLGKRTLIENISRLEPASLMRISGSGAETKIENVYRFNFEEKLSPDNIEKTIDELISLFSQACTNRSDSSNKNILALSGGRDSRAVAAALDNNKISFVAATFVDSAENYYWDSKIAEKVAQALRISWEKYNLKPPTGKDLATLLHIKGGLNYLAMGYIIQFFDRIMDRHGSTITYFTGDGGDKVLPNLNPGQGFRSIHDLVAYIISMNYVFPISEVSAITGMEVNEIIEDIENNLSGYPERDLNQKYVHFLLYERAFKWLSEGEDRNRFYFWSVSPFYSIPFFAYAMKCSDKTKLNDNLYRQFLSRLSLKVATIDYVGRPQLNKSKISKIIYYIKGRLKFSIRGSFLFPLYTRFLNGFRKQEKSNTENCLQEQVGDCKFVSEYLSYLSLQRITKKSLYYRKQAIENLFTLTSVIEKLFCGGATMKKYRDKYFI